MSSLSLGASKNSVLIAISKCPSFNYTSYKKDTVAGYTLTQIIDNAVDTVAHTTFNGQPTYVLGQTTQPSCKGDEAGIGSGVRSGTVGGEVKPTSGSDSVFIGGKSLVREGDNCTMNNGNVKGTYISVDTNYANEQLERWADESVEQALKEGRILAGPSTGMSNLDTSKFYFGGDKELEKAFNEIISTSHGRYIVSVIQNSDKILGVSIDQGKGLFASTKPQMVSVVVSEPKSWELWKSTKRVDKVNMVMSINMKNEDPYFVRADGKSLYKPTLTEVLAHELGHIKNYVHHGTMNYHHQSIVHENTIMRQLDKNSIVRHPNAEHGGGFND